MKNLDFSIITVCYNAADTIASTIKSVQAQRHISLEHIIIDGQSTDNTLCIIKDISDHRTYIISEADNGIYDAMNKGARLASGKYLIWLNADDCLASHTVLSDILAQLKPHDEVFCGSIEMIDKAGHTKRNWNARTCLYFGGRMFVQAPHPGFIVKNEVFKERKMAYDTRLKIAADMDLMLRLRQLGHKFRFSDIIVTKMLIGGESTAGFRSTLVGWYESYQVLKKYFLIFAFPVLVLRILTKFIHK